ncbi:hypothetical protein ABT340_06285 [Streptosporangium sp. NPDC000239]|uniref:hypothetical protein n=1 Tax=Streptosporangium sp. NPDC000239 TaxID=3154248 RepID=UPI00331C1130
MTTGKAGVVDERPRQAWPPERPEGEDASGASRVPQDTPRRTRRGSAPYAAQETRAHAAPTFEPPAEPHEPDVSQKARDGRDEGHLVWSPVAETGGTPGESGAPGAPRTPGTPGTWPPDRRPRPAQHRASLWDRDEAEPPEAPRPAETPETADSETVPTPVLVPVDGGRGGWVSEETDDGDLRGWTSEEFRGRTAGPWAFWRRGRARRLGRARREGEGIWPEESVWETHRPWPLNDDDSPQDELPPSARWYGSPVAPPPSRAGRLRRLLLGTVAAAAGLAVGFAVAVLLPPLLLWQAPSDAQAATRPAVVSDPVTGVTYPLPAGWRVGAVPPVTGFTSIAGGDGAVTVMTGPAEPGDDPAKTAAGLADLYGRLLLHGDEVKVVDDRAVTVNGRTGRSRSLRAEYHDVVNRPAYLRLVLLTGKGGEPVVVVGVAQPDDPALRGAIDKVISGLR